MSDHHERMTGTGYPQKKMGGAMGEAARLCAVADAYSAMTSKRTYAEAMEPMQAAAALAKDPGFDPEQARLLQALVLSLAKPK